MTGELPETFRLSKTIPRHFGPTAGLGGHNAIDEHGRWIVQLSIHDDAGDRFLNLLEGDTFEFVGATWRVAEIFEPTAATRGSVATITKVS